MTVEFVAATRSDQKGFWEQTALGLSLRRLAFDLRVISNIAFNNTVALGEVYNRRILAPEAGDILVFAHDDVWVDDFFFADHVAEGLKHFDVVGVVGNRRRVPAQPAWSFVDRGPDGKLRWDDPANLSGSVAHGVMPFGPVTRFGEAGPCELLDGVLLAARRSRLAETGVLFDPLFRFHLYDMDFCRTAREKGLSLGTWQLAITHQSGGHFGVGEWNRMYAAYLEKWRD